jgi:hypothetical protein
MQISDLHRKPSAFPNNRAFVSSLVSSVLRSAREDIPVPNPNLLVICGDIVQGSKEQDFNKAVKEIEHQYIEASDILNQLCSRLFNNDKEKVIIVPGNHDISFAHSSQSMERIDKPDVNLKELVKRPESEIRWSWDDLSFYHIKDAAMYEQRFKLFSDFFNRFYEDKRKWSLNADEQFSVFKYNKYKTLVIGFNSCFRNDHLNSMGIINPTCLLSCDDIVIDKEYDNWLKIAVWHHDVHGDPRRIDFLDDTTIQYLIDKGFKIGLHGHLHKDEIFEVRFSADRTIKMNVLGCGSASSYDVPIGYSNEYSIASISVPINQIRYFVRKAIEQYPLPIWMRGNVKQNNNKSYIDIKIEEPKESGGSRNRLPAPNDVLRKLYTIEQLMGNMEYEQALKLLLILDQKNIIVNRYTIECLAQLQHDKELVEIIKDPKSIIEFTYLTDALWRLQRFEEIEEILSSLSASTVFTTSAPYKRMKEKLSDRKKLNGKN